MATENEISRMRDKLKYIHQERLFDLLTSFVSEMEIEDDLCDFMIKNELLLSDEVYFK